LLKKLNKSHNILLFDGVCNLCNGFVQFVIKKDKADKIKFASLQSAAGQKLLLRHHLPTTQFQSFVYIKENKIFLKSTAALNLMKDIGGIWKLLYAFIIVPTFIRDFVYSIVAKNRYKWFGKQSSCIMPTKELMNKFLN
jgi:predicted DCC family thiol-disulfide oxidoreductase YuxK